MNLPVNEMIMVFRIVYLFYFMLCCSTVALFCLQIVCLRDYVDVFNALGLWAALRVFCIAGVLNFYVDILKNMSYCVSGKNIWMMYYIYVTKVQ